MEQQEKRSRRVGALTSLTVHGLLLLVFFFASGYRAPYPPAPEYGVIVNVGFDDQGTGDIQTDQPVSNPDVEEQKPEEQPKVEPEVIEQKPEEQKDDDQLLAGKEESPVTVKKEEEKPKEKPKEEVKPKDPPKEETKPKEQLKTEYKPDSQPANNNKGTSTTSEGDDVNKTGNKGQENGTLDPNGQYTGKPGGGGGGNGFGLSMGGWGWDSQPKLPELPDAEEPGRIEFEIECDADGQIIGIKTLQRGLSPKLEQLLKDEILRHSLVKNSAGAAPERSTGKIVFILKTR